MAVVLSASSFADVTFTGTVDPGTPGEVDPLEPVTVGPFPFGEPVGDPRGAIVVDGGSLLEVGQLLVGDEDSALARVEVIGAQTKLQVNGEGDSSLAVGRRGSGYLKIDDGAWVSVGSIENRSGVMTIGNTGQVFGSSPAASVEVLGESAFLTVGRELIVGEGVTSSLSIRDGAVVRVGGDYDPGVTINGVVEVSGARAELQTPALTIGSTSSRTPITYGELWIRDGAIVRSHHVESAGAILGDGSRIVLDGGTLALPINELSGTLQGSGTVTESLALRTSGQVLVNAGEDLLVQGEIESLGTVAVTDGALSVYGALVNQDLGESAGSLEFTGSEIDLLGGLDNRGPLTVTDSTLRITRSTIDGRNLLSSSGSQFSTNEHHFRAVRSRIEISGPTDTRGTLELIGSELVIDGVPSGPLNAWHSSKIVLVDSVIRSGECCGANLNNDGVIEARAGDNQLQATVYGGGKLEIGPDASIAVRFAEFNGGIEVAAGGTATFGFGARLNDLAITVTKANRDRASLITLESDNGDTPTTFVIGGELIVESEGLTDLETDEIFKLIEADRLEGDFSEFDLPDLPGTLEFLPELTDTELTLRVIDSTQTLPGDFSGDGRVDAADYTLWRDGLAGGSRWLDHAMWRANFGRTLASPGGASVPEPATAALALLGLLVAGRSRWGWTS